MSEKTSGDLKKKIPGVEELVGKIRKTYGFFGCPKKSDNIDLTDAEWKSIPWSKKEIEINAALPKHMWGRRQNDRVWPLCKAYRGENAIGPRAETLYPPKFKPTPPALVEGRGIARWISPGDKSILHVRMFEDYSRMWYPNNIPDHVEGIETNKNNDFGKILTFSRKQFLSRYGPSSLQKFTKESWLIRDPYHTSYHRMIKKKEKLHVPKSETGADVVFFWRAGLRWDSFDGYYIRNAFYLGLSWN